MVGMKKSETYALIIRCGEGNVAKVREILAEFPNWINATDLRGATPLIKAVESNHPEVVQLLLDKGAKLNLCSNDQWSPLHHCVSKDRGYVECLRLLLSKGNAKVNLCNGDGNTALNLCAMNNFVDCAKLLLEHGTNIDHVNKSSWSALMQACSKGRGFSNMVRLLVDHGADVNLKKDDGDTALGLCCLNGFSECAKILIENGAAVGSQKNNLWSPLMHCCGKGRGYLDIARLLVENGAEIDAVNAEENSALAICCMNGFYDLAEFLLENGANVNRQSKGGWGMLHQTVCKGRSDPVYIRIAELLVEHGIDVNLKNSELNTALNLAAMNGFHDIAELLVQNGADVNNQASDGWSPLHCTVGSSRGYRLTVELLISNKADVNLRNSQGVTPLSLCAMNNFFEIAKLLINAGADVNNQSKSGWTALMDANARDRGFSDISKLLIDAGADVKISNETGLTALHTACLYGSCKSVELLVQHGSDVNKQDKDGWTPLHCIFNGEMPSLESAKILLSHGCKVDSSDHFGYTPLHYWGGSKGNVEQGQLLLDHGADINRSANNGMTPVMFAAEAGDLDKVKFLVTHKANIASPVFDPDLRICCPSGHTLTEVEVESEVFCAACAKVYAAPFPVKTCKQCDYDICILCSKGSEEIHSIVSSEVLARREKHIDVAEYLASLQVPAEDSSTCNGTVPLPAPAPTSMNESQTGSASPSVLSSTSTRSISEDIVVVDADEMSDLDVSQTANEGLVRERETPRVVEDEIEEKENELGMVLSEEEEMLRESSEMVQSLVQERTAVGLTPKPGTSTELETHRNTEAVRPNSSTTFQSPSPTPATSSFSASTPTSSSSSSQDDADEEPRKKKGKLKFIKCLAPLKKRGFFKTKKQ